ncbi:MAG: AAA family ATPase [Gammaproteobacteria bacterium]
MKPCRRFTNLCINNIPETAKLVIMAGPNGSGKTSLFDGFNSWHKCNSGISSDWWDKEYHQKIGVQEISNAKQAINIDFYNLSSKSKEHSKKYFYFRTAYRHAPNCKLDNLKNPKDVFDDWRIKTMIDIDTEVGNNYHRIISKAFNDVFVAYQDADTIGEFRYNLIGKINIILQRIFPALSLHSFGNPLVDGTFLFNKGLHKRFSYKNLSGGEKAVFDILLDMIIKTIDFDDTIFCIDEPDLHMNSSVQGALLHVLYDMVNDQSQLWIATHAIGMMRKAKDLNEQYPGTVVFLDFDRDFDYSQTLEPIKPNRCFWERILNVAVDDISELVAPRRIIICEGVPYGGDKSVNVAHDAECLNIIFAEEFPDTKFIPGGNCHDIIMDKHVLVSTIKIIAKGVDVIRLIDKDQMAEHEVEELEDKGINVLSRRHLESYLFDEEVIDALCEKTNNANKKKEIRQEMLEIIENLPGRGKSVDDIKAASGEIYIVAKKILGLTNAGTNARDFMRSTLAPLITTNMNVYKELRDSIFKKG